MKPILKIVALCLSFAGMPAAYADELGRLFFTPAQRTQLNYSKFQESDDSGSERASLTLNGIVQRQGGARTAWINGVPQSAGSGDERNPASLPVTVPTQTRPVTVKVGQKLNVNLSNDSPH